MRLAAESGFVYGGSYCLGMHHFPGSSHDIHPKFVADIEIPRVGKHPLDIFLTAYMTVELRNCRACGKAVSPRATSCPSCGEPTPGVSLEEDRIVNEIARWQSEERQQMPLYLDLYSKSGGKVRPEIDRHVQLAKEAQNRILAQIVVFFVARNQFLTPTATRDRPIGGGRSRSSGSAHGATSVSNSFTCPTLCAVDLLTCALYIHPARPIGLV
jgi:hypothetical protein